ncbi:hypothetical protein NC651_028186 [Populus alba x Populus x berolinensis]|nr:hypothetical protein NC651_028186 [Populus alba x Populus x berolinensis]
MSEDGPCSVKGTIGLPEATMSLSLVSGVVGAIFTGAVDEDVTAIRFRESADCASSTTGLTTYLNRAETNLENLSFLKLINQMSWKLIWIIITIFDNQLVPYVKIESDCGQEELLAKTSLVSISSIHKSLHGKLSGFKLLFISHYMVRKSDAELQFAVHIKMIVWIEAEKGFGHEHTNEWKRSDLRRMMMKLLYEKARETKWNREIDRVIMNNTSSSLFGIQSVFGMLNEIFRLGEMRYQDHHYKQEPILSTNDLVALYLDPKCSDMFFRRVFSNEISAKLASLVNKENQSSFGLSFTLTSKSSKPGYIVHRAVLKMELKSHCDTHQRSSSPPRSYLATLPYSEFNGFNKSLTIYSNVKDLNRKRRVASNRFQNYYNKSQLHVQVASFEILRSYTSLTITPIPVISCSLEIRHVILYVAWKY